MNNRYAVFDVETPNRFSDSMCAIGVTLVEQMQMVDQFYTLVNPEDTFDWGNIQIHGITPQMVQNAPTFDALWPQLQPWLDGRILVAHNATFDLSVLSRCLRRAGICWKREVEFVCTVRMGRKCLPDAPNHKLNTLSDVIGVSLNHHNAGSDSLACAQLLRYCLRHNTPSEPFLRRYDLALGKTIPTRVRAGI